MAAAALCLDRRRARLACAAALATIDVIEKQKLASKAGRLGRYLLEQLTIDGFKARGKGLMIGVDVKKGRETVLNLIKQKILTIHSKNTVRVLPPLMINRGHCNQFTSALNKVV